jgi:hypothetical protein
MRKQFISYSVAAASMAGVLSLLLVAKPGAQGNRPAGGAPQNNRLEIQKVDAKSKATPRMPDGHPDLSGFYGVGVAGITNASEDERILTAAPDGSIFFNYAGAEGGAGHPDDGARVTQAPNQPPYKPEYKAKVDAIAATVYGTITNLDPALSCIPAGVPRASVGGALHVIQHPKYIAILYENNPGPIYRIIYTDGRKHPERLDTSFMGHSIGHWEGDTLVVDTVGLNDETWYTQTGGNRKLTSIHSDQEHVVERFTRVGDELQYQAVVEDPIMLTKPWVLNPQRTQIGPSDDYIMPQRCNTNDKGHIIQPSETDKFQCNFCVKDSDALYGEGGGDRDRRRAQERANNPNQQGQ